MAVVIKRTKVAVRPTENSINTNRSGNHTPVNGMIDVYILVHISFI